MSIVLHLLIFGSAIAFAQFARGALWGHRDVIMVSLVGSESGPRGGALQKIGHQEEQTYKKPVVSQGKEAAAIPTENPPMGQPALGETLIPVIQKGKGNDSGDADDGGARKGQTGAGVMGSGSGTQFGLIPAEQWAVIESALERSKTYPRMARERGIQGVVHVRFKLRPSGDVETVEIVKSSGYDILDSASVRTVYRAAPMPYVNGWVEVPMAYVLK